MHACASPMHAYNMQPMPSLVGNFSLSYYSLIFYFLFYFLLFLLHCCVFIIYLFPISLFFILKLIIKCSVMLIYLFAL